MMKEFTDKNYWAIILGGSSGLGLAAAKKLSAHGMNLIILHRSRKSALEELEKNFNEITAKNVKLISYNMDALQPDNRSFIISEIKKKIGSDGGIRILLHSIAKGNLKPMISGNGSSLKNDDFHLTINAMAVSLYEWTKDLFDNNLFTKDARVISFTSEGSMKAWKNYAAVSASKAALESITRSIALEFAPFGIRANCIQAGVTDTPSFRLIPGSSRLAEYSIARNPFNKLTLPEDVANVVYLLSLDEAAWINGAVIPVNGGEHIS
jgi:enoyl-[acyl-carrier protein] reductase I